MSKVKIICLKTNFDSVLVRLQKLNLVQIEKTERGTHIQNQQGIAEIDEKINKTKRAAEILSQEFVPQKKSGLCNTKQAVEKIHAAYDSIEHLKDQNKKQEETLSILSHYKKLDMSITYNDSETFDFKTGYLTGSFTEELLNSTYRNIYFEVLSTEKDKTYVWAVCKKEHIKELAQTGFTELDIKTPLNPREYSECIKGKIRQNNILIESHKKNYRRIQRVLGHVFSVTYVCKKRTTRRISKSNNDRKYSCYFRIYTPQISEKTKKRIS